MSNQSQNEEIQTTKPKHRDKLVALDSLSLGLSIVVAILIGVGLGVLMKNIFNQDWLLWLGVIWGIGGAISNIYKVYIRQKKELDSLADDPKYKHSINSNQNFDDAN